jgi:hypothetical protein
LVIVSRLFAIDGSLRLASVTFRVTGTEAIHVGLRRQQAGAVAGRDRQQLE